MLARVLFVGLLMLYAPAVMAQDFLTLSDSCVNNIPASARSRVPVFIEASAAVDPLGLLPQADFFAQAVAVRMRELLGGHEPDLPEADTVLAWNLLWGQLTVIAHRNQKPTWSVRDKSNAVDSLPRSPLRLLRRSVEDVVASGETITMPENASPDSMDFGLSFVAPTVDRSGKTIPLKARQPIPVFTIAVAWTRPVEVKRNPDIDYPDPIGLKRYVGKVRLGHVVNPTGRVDASTIEDLWPAGVAQPSAEILRAYNGFVAAARKGLPSARFSPASIGGCVVSQRVEQAFQFEMRER